MNFIVRGVIVRIKEQKSLFKIMNTLCELQYTYKDYEEVVEIDSNRNDSFLSFGFPMSKRFVYKYCTVK